MLQAIRDRATGWIAWVIVILICIPFAMWGVNEYLGTGGDLSVAKVNDSEIGYYQYRGAVQQQRQQLQQMFGGAIPEGLISDARLREQALERLIGEEVLVQQAVNNGLRVGDRQLATAIRDLPAFQQAGNFSQAAYDQFLRSRGTTAPGFELDLRRSMLSEQIITALRRTAIVTGEEVDSVFRVRNEQRRFQVLRVDLSSMDVTPPDDEAIRTWYEANPDLYVQPEQVKVRYLEIDRSRIAGQVTADESELEAIYKERVSQGSYVTPEQREARHILITVAADAPQEEVDRARAELDALRARIVSGEDFGEVAKTGSQDPGSASQGGSLGLFGRGIMDPAFEEAAYAQPVGELGEPVRSRFGWHLIEVTQIQPEKVRPFAQARAEVLEEYQDAQASQIFAEHAERLANLTFEHPESLEAAAQALDITPASTDFFSRDGTAASGIAANASVRDAAFNDDVLNAGNNSELVELDPNRLVVLRIGERRESRPRTLDEVRDEVAALLRAKAQAEKASALGKEILSALRSGTAAEAVATEHGLTWAESATATRADNGGLDPAVAEILFRMPKPDAGAPSIDGTELPGRGFVVVRLTDVSQAPATDGGAEVRQRVAEELESTYGEQAFTAVMQGLRERTSVEVFQQNLNPDEG